MLRHFVELVVHDLFLLEPTVTNGLGKKWSFFSAG